MQTLTTQAGWYHLFPLCHRARKHISELFITIITRTAKCILISHSINIYKCSVYSSLCNICKKKKKKGWLLVSIMGISTKNLRSYISHNATQGHFNLDHPYYQVHVVISEPSRHRSVQALEYKLREHSWHHCDIIRVIFRLDGAPEDIMQLFSIAWAVLLVTSHLIFTREINMVLL